MPTSRIDKIITEPVVRVDAITTALLVEEVKRLRAKLARLQDQG